MLVYNIGQIERNNKTMIVDAHAHLGEDFVFDECQTEQELIEVYDANHVDKAIVQPFICRPYLEDTRAAHDKVACMCRNHLGRIFGMASINPHFRPVDYEREAERCVKELGFVGLKMSTIAHAINPSSRDGMHVFEVAQALKIPVMIHTGSGAPLADPMSAWRALEVFPDVTAVLAHAGGNGMYAQAVILARKYDNVYLEPSWAPSVYIAAMVQEIGADRVLFSSDTVGNLAPALATFRALIRNDQALNTVLGQTAHSIYRV